MEWMLLIAPAVIAAAVSGVVSVVVFFVSAQTAKKIQNEKLASDEKLAEQKFEFDKRLAERKFSLDIELANRKRRQDLAEEVLADFYEVRDVMRFVRCPGGFEGEGETRQKHPGETGHESRKKNTYFAPIERYQAREEVVARLMSRKNRMMAWFGPDAEEPFGKLNSQILKVLSSARMLSGPYHSDSDPMEPSHLQALKTDIGWGGADTDAIAAGIDAAVAAMEEICRPALAEHGVDGVPMGIQCVQ